MIPYFDISTFRLGPIIIYTWGFVVSIGFLVAILTAYRRAKLTGLNANRMLDLAFWIIVFAFIGARLFHVFFYEWPYYRMHLSQILRVDQGGLSSFGGFIGATVAFVFWGRRYRLDLWRYADLLMFAWPLGHGIGRIGCFLVHMHPGYLSIVPWAVQYPGGARLDMGLIESVVLLIYWGLVWLTTRGRKLFDGVYLVLGMMFYGTVRFVFDFFRATDLPMSDARYFGLTPAQYGSIVLMLIGFYFTHSIYESRRTLRTVTTQ